MSNIAPRGLKLTALVALSVSIAAPSAASAQATPTRVDTVTYILDPVLVTATRGPREVSKIPQPVSVVQRIEVERALPNSVSDLFRTLPGLDVTGVGVNQGRPQIRGLKGQRILLLQDGLRLNNSRRQQDFGELPALVDVSGVERVEVVRGPGSVLYGSDALGGVVNVITREPQVEGLHGSGSFRYGAVEEQRAGHLRLFGRFGDWSVQAGGSVREADAYFAPAGSFGNVTLADQVKVDGSGTRDENVDLRIGRMLGEHSVFAKFDRYQAHNSGFGSVDPAAYDPGGSEIRITYPVQTFNKISTGYLGHFESPLADQLEVLAYGQNNARDLRFGIGPFGAGPGATIEIDNYNTTDIRTYGGRLEARKLAGRTTLITYGVDAWRDRAVGTDVNTTYFVGFGPAPFEDVSDRPQLPDATYLSVGGFLQGEVEAGDRVSIVAGTRYQVARAETFATPGLEDQTPVSISDGTLVGSLNTVVRLTPTLSAVGTVGRGFRSPNIIERFFDGATPEGGGYQIRNPDLVPETSLNVDLGARYREGRLGVEVFAFRNKIHDGIRIVPTGTQVAGQDAFMNTNIDELVFRGVEASFDAGLAGGLTLLGSYTWLDTEDANDVDNPVGEAFSSKQSATLRFDPAGQRFWAAGEVRRNGTQKDPGFAPGNPIGDVMPSFTVVNVRGGFVLSRDVLGMQHQLNVAVTNLTNTLYAEFSNAGFFRPEPKRNLTLSWTSTF